MGDHRRHSSFEGIKLMAYVKQLGKNDCGVACLAMLCDVEYSIALRAIPFRKRGLMGGTTTAQIREGASTLGYTTKSTPQNRLKVVYAPKDWGGLAGSLTSDWWYLIPDNSLVKIKFDQCTGGNFHWVVWRKQKIYDPARGVFHPSRYGYKPISYMEFVKCE